MLEDRVNQPSSGMPVSLMHVPGNNITYRHNDTVLQGTILFTTPRGARMDAEHGVLLAIKDESECLRFIRVDDVVH